MKWVFSIKLLFYVFIVILQMEAYQTCIEKERAGLLHIKSHLLSSNCDILDPLDSWVDDQSSNCCNWDRITCNNDTFRRVISISLHNTLDYFLKIYCNLNISLFHPFEELIKLDLSDNSFSGWINGTELSKLTNLQVLNIRGNNFEDFSSVKGLEGMKKLHVLDVSWNLFRKNILSSISTFTSLKTLIFEGNFLIGDFAINEFGNLKKLVRNLKKLEVLRIGNNGFSGTLSMEGFERLKKLQVLDISWNSFNGSNFSSIIALPSLKALILRDSFMSGYSFITELGALKQVEVLDISYNEFNDTLSMTGLCELRRLVELSLQGNHFSGPVPKCLANLTNLQVLDLSYNQLCGNFQSVVSQLTSLKHLILSGNQFEGIFSFNTLANHTRLQIFEMSSPSLMLKLETETPAWFPAFQLKVIVLCNWSLKLIPDFLLYQHDLRLIDISHNKLIGRFPGWILRNNSKLRVMNLRNNSLAGTIVLSNSKRDLVQLDISSNNFTGQLPKDIGMVLANLNYMNFSNNCFEGNAPSSIGDMQQLNALDLSNNNFSGELPGTLFSSSKDLVALVLSNNNFWGKILPNTVNLSSLYLLDMKNNNFNGNIDVEYFYCPKLYIIDISNNRIAGIIPSVLLNLKQLVFLDLSQNRLFGEMPYFFDASSLRYLFLQKNHLNGSIPHGISRSYDLRAVDLSYNNFSGSIPLWISQLTGLHSLLLKGNQLSGHIPNQVCQLRNLTIMDFSNNLLGGSIPSCFDKISFSTIKEDDFASADLPIGLTVDDSYVDNASIKWDSGFNSLPSSDVVIEFVMKYRYNSYKGYIINLMAGIDLSHNKLIGEIPSEIGQLYNVRSLNLSFNHLSGSIPISFSNLKNLESLDLHNNNLTGEISVQLVRLNFLVVFDVSYNNLSGRILDKGQFGTFNESCYKGNPGLCGDLIHRSCNTKEGMPVPSSSIVLEKEDDSFIDMVWFYWSFSASYVSVLLGLATILYTNRYWCMLWFDFVDTCMDWCQNCLFFGK